MTTTPQAPFASAAVPTVPAGCTARVDRLRGRDSDSLVGGLSGARHDVAFGTSPAFDAPINGTRVPAAGRIGDAASSALIKRADVTNDVFDTPTLPTGIFPGGRRRPES